MCGIVGAAGALEYKDKDALTILMHLCELRGEDSTGFFTVAKDNREAVIHKVAGPTRSMFDTRQWDNWRPFDQRIFVGHCRKATVGKISRSTAHPFNYDHITGVHNGTLRNWRYLLDKEEETDSMTLFKAISERGTRPVIDATDGAYAMVWYDEAEDTLNFLRNKERTLYYAMSKDYKRIFWASEAWMLNVALNRAGIDMADFTPQEKYLTTTNALEEDTWWRVKVGRRGDKEALTFLEDHDEKLKGGVNPAKYQAAPFRGTYQAPFPVAQGVPGRSGATAPSGSQSDTTKTPVASTTTNSSTAGTQTAASASSEKGSQASRPTLSLVHDNKKGGSAPSTSEKNAGVSAKDPPLLVNGKPVVLGYNGLTFEKAEFDTWVDPNCIWCQTAFTFDDILDDPKVIGEWTEDEKFICAKCMEDDTLASVVRSCC